MIDITGKNTTSKIKVYYKPEHTMTTHQLERLLNHPVINARGLCNEAGLSYSDVYDIISKEYEITEDESQKIEAYLSTRGIEWRDLIKE